MVFDGLYRVRKHPRHPRTSLVSVADANELGVAHVSNAQDVVATTMDLKLQ